MRPEGESSHLEKETVPKNLIDAIDNNGELFYESPEKWAEKVGQQALDILEDIQTFEDFQKVLEQINTGIRESELIKSIGASELSVDDFLSPIYKFLLKETARKYRFEEE